ncbi:uncharacterized protein [Physcomitrium patens]|uniref:uncharacterized protein isoform X2 n=1 Tax=Physcomitrium patens TaxID=3218 RepID=UPI003CCD1B9E
MAENIPTHEERLRATTTRGSRAIMRERSDAGRGEVRSQQRAWSDGIAVAVRGSIERASGVASIPGKVQRRSMRPDAAASERRLPCYLPRLPSMRTLPRTRGGE